MAWRKLNNSNFLKPADFEKGDVMVEGNFVGTRPTQYGDAYDFKASDGEIYSLSGYLPIATQMEGVDPGTLCRVTYEGQIKSKNAYKYHSFTVEVSDTAELTYTAAAATSTPSPRKYAAATTAAADEDVDDVTLDDDDDVEAEEVKPKRTTLKPRR